MSDKVFIHSLEGDYNYEVDYNYDDWGGHGHLEQAILWHISSGDDCLLLTTRHLQNVF